GIARTSGGRTLGGRCSRWVRSAPVSVAPRQGAAHGGGEPVRAANGPLGDGAGRPMSQGRVRLACAPRSSAARLNEESSSPMASAPAEASRGAADQANATINGQLTTDN